MDRLVIGTRRYSSWSLRGWLAVQRAGLGVPDYVIPLRGGGQTQEIHALSPNGLVPYLEHQGVRIWESLAICEYCAEFEPSLWPEERVVRAVARSLAAEVHAGFIALRRAFPMNTGRAGRPLIDLSDEVCRDIDKIDRLWSETRAQYDGSGPFLFGADLTITDIMFAPVVLRFKSYAVTLSSGAASYAQAVFGHPLMQEWLRLAAQEPTEWQLERYETLL